MTTAHLSVHVPAAAPSREAITEAGRIIAEARRVRDSLPVDEAARRAWTPTGPTLDELEALIRAQREEIH